MRVWKNLSVGVFFVLSATNLVFAAEQSIFKGDTRYGVPQQVLIIDENDQSGDLKLQFGNALNQYLQWNNNTNQFEFSNNVNFGGYELKDFRAENASNAPICDGTRRGRMYHNSATSKTFVCNGTVWEQIDPDGMRWTYNGNVLFPETTTSDMAVGGDSLANSMFSIDESSGTFLFGGNQSANPTLNFEATNNSAGSFGFNTNDSFYFSGSKVGIGTINPLSLLTISENTSNEDGSAGLTIEQAGSGDAVAQFLLPSLQRWVVGIDNSDADKFKIASTQSLDSDARLTIQVDGKVGIGATSPDSPLEILSPLPQLKLSYADNTIDGSIGINVSEYLVLQAGTTAESKRVMIGTGGGGSATPDMLGLDVKNTTGDPSGFAGAMYYNIFQNSFRCYQASSWVDCIRDSLTVNGAAVTDADLDNTTPAAPNHGVNVTWQKDASSPANISAYVSGVAIPVDRDTTSTIVASATNTEQTLYSYTIPANMLGTDRIVKMTVLGAYKNNSGTNQTLRVRYKFGGTTVWNDVTANAANSSQERGFRFEFWIANQGVANSQTGAGTAFIGGTGTSTNGSGDLGSDETLADAHITFGDPAINTTSATSMEITVQMSTSNSGASVRQDLAYVELY